MKIKIIYDTAQENLVQGAIIQSELLLEAPAIFDNDILIGNIFVSTSETVATTEEVIARLTADLNPSSIEVLE